MIEPIQRRLTWLFTTVILAFAAIVLAAASAYLFHGELADTLAAHFHEEALEHVMPLAARNKLERLAEQDTPEWIQVFDRSGALAFATVPKGSTEPPLDRSLLAAAFAGKQRDTRAMLEGSPVLVSYFPVNAQYAGRSINSLVVLQRFERRMWLGAFLILPLMLAASFVISRYLVRKAMVPISEIFTYQETYSSNVTHELMSPLASLKGNLEVALRRNRDAEEYRAVIRLGLQEVDRIVDLLDILGLLASSKFRPADLDARPVRLRGVLEELVEAHRPRIEQRGIVLTLGGEADPVCECDRTLIRRALENLLDNAVKYTPNAGTIRIQFSTQDDRAAIEFTNTCRPGDPGARERLFEPFVRGPHAHEGGVPGKGLGLYIARYIARSHGGTITLNRITEREFSITLTLPHPSRGAIGRAKRLKRLLATLPGLGARRRT